MGIPVQESYGKSGGGWVRAALTGVPLLSFSMPLQEAHVEMSYTNSPTHLRYSTVQYSTAG